MYAVLIIFGIFTEKFTIVSQSIRALFTCNDTVIRLPVLYRDSLAFPEKI